MSPCINFYYYIVISVIFLQAQTISHIYNSLKGANYTSKNMSKGANYHPKKVPKGANHPPKNALKGASYDVIRLFMYRRKKRY